MQDVDAERPSTLQESDSGSLLGFDRLRLSFDFREREEDGLVSRGLLPHRYLTNRHNAKKDGRRDSTETDCDGKHVLSLRTDPRVGRPFISLSAWEVAFRRRLRREQ